MSPRWRFAAPSALLGLLFPVAAAAVAPDSIRVHCRVFRDLNGSGAYDAGEPLLAGVHVTNGHDIFSTDGQGTADLSVDRAQYRFATLTIPAGFWPTTPWYHWVPVGHAGPDSVDFGLRDCPESRATVDSLQWVHISDTHVQTWTGQYRFDVDLQEINQRVPRPLFIINTGDLVDLGRDSTCWNHYVAMRQASALEVFSVPGNHDIIPTSRPLDYFERWVGPPYYSIDAGNWHFVIYCGDANNAASAVPLQDAWLAADLASAPAGAHVVMCQHYMLQESDTAKVATWNTSGVRACFSGHWHSHQFAERPNGMRDYNISWIRQGGVDRTPRVYGVVTFKRNGEIRYDQRRLGTHHRYWIASPQRQQTVGHEAVEVLVEAYDASSEVSSLTATVSAGGRSVSASLTPEGLSLWRAIVDASSLPNGACSISVAGAFADGTPITQAISVVLADVIPIVRAPNTDWPMFRRCSAGSSFVARSLPPPLELAWCRPVPGLVALSSPVVARSTVYLGCRAEHGPEDAGVIAFDAATGVQKWFTHLPSGVALAPAVVNNVVIATSLADSVYGLDANTGAHLWSVPQILPRYTMTAPIFEADTAWVGTEPGVQKVRASTGALGWRSTPFGDPWYPVIYSAPAVSASYLYYGVFGWAAASTGGFKIFDRASGNLVHDEGGCFRSPLVAGGTVYAIGAADMTHQVLTARDATGNVLWTAAKGLGAGTGSPALGRGVLVVAGASGAIEAFRASDGTNLWTKRVSPQLFDMEQGWGYVPSTPATPAICDTVVYVGSLDGNLYALQLFTGTELWRWPLGTPIASSPAISGNMLFVATEDEHLYGLISTSKRVAQAPRLGSEPEFRFMTPYPNPTASGTSLSWIMSGHARVSVSIYDVRGRLVRTVVDDQFDAGHHQVTWNGLDASDGHVPSGVYWAQLRVGTRSAAQRLVLLRR